MLYVRFLKGIQSWTNWSGLMGREGHVSHTVKLQSGDIISCHLAGDSWQHRVRRSLPRRQRRPRWAHRVGRGSSSCSMVFSGSFDPPFVGCDTLIDVCFKKKSIFITFYSFTFFSAKHLLHHLTRNVFGWGGNGAVSAAQWYSIPFKQLTVNCDTISFNDTFGPREYGSIIWPPSASPSPSDWDSAKYMFAWMVEISTHLIDFMIRREILSVTKIQNDNTSVSLLFFFFSPGNAEPTNQSWRCRREEIFLPSCWSCYPGRCSSLFGTKAL